MNIFNYPKTRNFLSSAIGIAIFVCFLSTSVEVVFAERMTSGNYVLEADSMNFGGARSTSASYGLEDTGGEVGTGFSNSTNNNLRAGFQQAATISVSTSTPPASTPDSGSTGISGSFLPVNVINFTATPLEKNILLSWNYPLDSKIVSVRIVRSDKFFPNDISDGEVIFEGDVESVLDNNVIIGQQYYYALFAKNQTGIYSSGVLAQARLSPLGDITPPLTPSEIFENIPIIPTTDPVISDLSLLDFDFIQNNRKIAQVEGIVPVDGTQNLTIRLSYDKVPEILKTIAITLTDPSDKTKVFTFLLRVNENKTAYEATIAPLGRSGDYKLNAIILDYKNQGLKRLNGQLRALVLEEGEALFGLDGKHPKNLFWMIIFLVLAFIAIIILVVVEKKKKEKKSLQNNLPQ